jgi:hypothetical protein
MAVFLRLLQGRSFCAIEYNEAAPQGRSQYTRRRVAAISRAGNSGGLSAIYACVITFYNKILCVWQDAAAFQQQLRQQTNQKQSTI